MNQNDLLLALSQQVEAQGGTRMPDSCDGSLVGDPPFRTCHCGQESIFVTTYQPIDPRKVEKGAGFVRACGFCDMMFSWPRYRKEIEKASL